MFFTDEQRASIPIHLVCEEDCEDWRSAQDEVTRNWLLANAFKGERGKLVLIPRADGAPAAVVVGLGRRGIREEFSCWTSAGLPDRLPDGDYHLAQSLDAASAAQFTFGWAYGQYRFERYRRSSSPRAVQLRAPQGVDVAEIERLYRACSLVRDLINTPANDMTPEALAAAAIDLAQRCGAQHREIVGDALLAERFPAVHAVGRASAVAPRLIDIQWGDATHPKVTRLIYPGRADHPQADVIKKQMRAGSTMIGFEVKGGKAGAFRALNGFQVARISNNLGDSKSIVTHPATTTHQRLTPDERAELGIGDGFIRFSVGLEHVDDLIEDVQGALEKV